MTQFDKLFVEVMAKAIYDSDKGFISDMRQCRKAARHALKAKEKYDNATKTN